MATADTFTTVRSLGGLLPVDLLQRVADLDRDLPGLQPPDYGLGAGERLREAIARSWNRLTGVWEGFRNELDRLPESDRATSATRERWLLILLQELGFGRVPTATATQIDGTTYAVSHRWGHVPIHLLGWNVDIERRAEGVAGAARMSPHALVQEYLNRSDEQLWAVLSNGRTLRLLRDNISLSRQAFVEFDLEAMFDGEVYADFVLLWLGCHASRFEGDRPELCLLEQWVTAAHRDGTRALDQLRDGVEKALSALGSGLLDHPANQQLRDRLAAGELTPTDYYRQLLRVVYRLLFLFVAEDRDLLLLRGDEAARQRYHRWYSTRTLRQLARVQAGGRHDDRWDLLTRVFALLGSSEGCADLALPPLGSGLWDHALTGDVVGTGRSRTRLRNIDLLDAVRHLAWTTAGGVVRSVDYRNLGAEELGSVYEALLEMHPGVSLANRQFTLSAGAGNERKTTGSYYTPTSLITQLLDTALDPVLEQAVRQRDPEAALLEVTVCDPACGSGHFLVAAAHRIARRLAAVRSGDDEASPELVQEAMRDVVSRCLYGVDINPMAIELARVNLWLEAQVPGKPLSFLEHHLKVGNALLGATPGLVVRGIPDDAFKPIEGDDRKVAAEFRRANRTFRDRNASQQQLLLAAEDDAPYNVLAGAASDLTDMPDDTLERQLAKAEAHAAFEVSEALRRQRLVADTWCAVFTFPKVSVTQQAAQFPHELFYELRDGTAPPHSAAYETVAAERATYRYFHWHLEFPHLFELVDDPGEDLPTGWQGGFSVLLGNPPWDQVQFDDREFFGISHPEIADAPTMAARKRMIQALTESDSDVHASYMAAKRAHDGLKHLLHASGTFPLTSFGRMNTYSLFAERFRHVMSRSGRSGFIVPTGIATDYYNAAFFADLVASRSLTSLFDFENRAKLFPAVDSRMKFCLLTLTGEDAPVDAAEFAFFAHAASDLRDQERRFTLTPEDIELINPNTRTAPVFRTRRDAEICAKIYRNVPVLIREGDPQGNPWGLQFMLMFMMNTDSHLFATGDQLESEDWTLVGNAFEKDGERYLPLVEGKTVHHFDHRWTTYEANGDIRDATVQEKFDPRFEVLPRYWVAEDEIQQRLDDKGWSNQWLLGWRDICRSTDERTHVAAIIPRTAVGNKLPIALPDAPLMEVLVLLADLSSFAHDYPTRQKVGGTHINFFIMEQLPAVTPAISRSHAPWDLGSRLSSWVGPRVVELTGTSHVVCRAIGRKSAFPWRPARRQILRAELDAGFFHLYGLDRDEVDYVMETFPIVRRKDERAHGEYRTKRLILEIYDDMAKAIKTGEPYKTRLDPPPADESLQLETSAPTDGPVRLAPGAR